MLGLGGKYYIDYCPNARKPKLELEKDDYVNFGCKPALPLSHDMHHLLLPICLL